MRVYGKVKIVFWEDEKISALDDSAKLLALYCLTGEHSNAIGCYRLPLGYIQTDLRWNEEKAKQCLQTLIAIGFVMYDEETQFLLIPNYLEHNPIENSRVGKMCVGLVNAAMRSKLFPHLIKALKPQKNRFILKDKDLWEPKWDTVCDKTKQRQYTISHTVYDTVSDSVPDTVSSKNSAYTERNAEQHGETGEYTLLDTVSDTLSDRVYSESHDMASPEPEPEPHPQPEPEIIRDDDMRTHDVPLAIIRAFDAAIVEVFGKEQARPWPHSSDMEIAREFIKAGADVELCRQLFLKQQYARKRKGQFPIGSLAYFRTAVPDALNEKKYYQNNPLPEKRHEQRAFTGSAISRPRSGHDTFTEALVEVVHEREQD